MSLIQVQPMLLTKWTSSIFTSHIALYKNSLSSQVTQYSTAAPLLAVLLQLLSDETHPTAIRARAGFSLGACSRSSAEELY